MKLVRPTPAEGAVGLRAMVTVARAPGEIPNPARRLIEAAQKVLLGSAEPIDELAPVSPEELAATIDRPEIRNQLVNGMVLATLSSGEPPPKQVDVVRGFAHAPYLFWEHLGQSLGTLGKIGIIWGKNRENIGIFGNMLFANLLKPISDFEIFPSSQFFLYLFHSIFYFVHLKYIFLNVPLLMFQLNMELVHKIWRQLFFQLGV